jgi:hypothetical protein
MFKIIFPFKAIKSMLYYTNFVKKTPETNKKNVHVGVCLRKQGGGLHCNGSLVRVGRRLEDCGCSDAVAWRQVAFLKPLGSKIFFKSLSDWCVVILFF